MLKIEFQKINENDRLPYVIVNDIPDFDSKLYHSNTAHFENKDVLNIILSNSISQIGELLKGFSFDLAVDWWADNITISIDRDNIDDDVILRYILNVNVNSWSAGWSLNDFEKTLKTTVNHFDNKSICFIDMEQDFDSYGFWIEFIIDDLHIELSKLIETHTAYIKKVIELTKETLSISQTTNSLITLFDFPESIKSSCQQYLMYFAQFLKDLGIEAELKLKNRLNQPYLRLLLSINMMV
jgi:hypothetical protein